MPMRLFAVDQPAAPPLTLTLSDRIRHDVTYLATPAGTQDAPATLPAGEYWIRRADAERILANGAITIVSPLDSASRTEIELSEDQERLLEWAVRYAVQHVRMISS